MSLSMSSCFSLQLCALYIHNMPTDGSDISAVPLYLATIVKFHSCTIADNKVSVSFLSAADIIRVVLVINSRKVLSVFDYKYTQ